MSFGFSISVGSHYLFSAWVRRALRKLDADSATELPQTIEQRCGHLGAREDARVGNGGWPGLSV
jgi:hypothetical protein